MSLDIHVMPLGAFLAGEYTTATERLGEGFAFPVTRIGREKAMYPREEADRLSRQMRRWLEQRTLSTEAWFDEGEIAFSEQFQFDTWHAVRAFAAHCEISDGPFTATEAFHEHEPLCRASAIGSLAYTHLIEHEDNEGFYAPIDFKRPLRLLGDGPRIGSSIRLMMELAELRQRLGEFPDHASLRAGTPLVEEHPGLYRAKYGVAFLYAACWASVQTRLPIIFDG